MNVCETDERRKERVEKIVVGEEMNMRGTSLLRVSRKILVVDRILKNFLELRQIRWFKNLLKLKMIET